MSVPETVAEAGDHLFNKIRAGVQMINVVIGGQAAPAEVMLKRVAERLSESETIAARAKTKGAKVVPYLVSYWDAVYGLAGIENTANPTVALMKALTLETFQGQHSLIVFRDIRAQLMDNPVTRNEFRRVAGLAMCLTSRMARPVILLTVQPIIHPDLEPYIQRIELPLPGHDELLMIVDGRLREAPPGSLDDVTEEQKAELREQTARTLRGLSAPRATDVLSQSMVAHRGFVPAILKTIEDEKAQVVSANEAMTYVSRDRVPPADQLGGYVQLKEWLRLRKHAFTPAARAAGIDLPKGIGIIGVQGTGKSRAGEVVAGVLGLPLVRFDFGAVFSALVGETERKTREAIALAERQHGCVFFLDEVDKTLGGAHQAGGDSGTTQRAFATVLTWLASKRSETFVVMTMNRVAGLPPELLRRGRLDELFFVDVPTSSVRREIWEIHLKTRGIEPSAYKDAEWKKMDEITEGFVGAEVEQLIIDARFLAWDQSGGKTAKPSLAHFRAAAARIIPETVRNKEAIDHIREYSKNYGRSVELDMTAETDAGRRLTMEIGDMGANLGLASPRDTRHN